MFVHRKIDASRLYYQGYQHPLFYTPNKRFTMKISISSTSKKEKTYSFKIVVKDLTQNRINATHTITHSNSVEANIQ